MYKMYNNPSPILYKMYIDILVQDVIIILSNQPTPQHKVP